MSARQQLRLVQRAAATAAAAAPSAPPLAAATAAAAGTQQLAGPVWRRLGATPAGPSLAAAVQTTSAPAASEVRLEHAAPAFPPRLHTQRLASCQGPGTTHPAADGRGRPPPLGSPQQPTAAPAAAAAWPPLLLPPRSALPKPSQQQRLLRHAARQSRPPPAVAAAAAAAVPGLWRRMYGGAANAALREGEGNGGGAARAAALDAGAPAAAPADTDEQLGLTPQAVVEFLDRHIIGQADAKRAVAIAFRNRWRRHRVPLELRDEIVPKNLLMIGPTGCGKTEIARRLAKLADAPFVKVEATKFTEVGYHGRDVDAIVRDLVEAALTLVRTTLRTQRREQIEVAVMERVVAQLAGAGASQLDLSRLRRRYRAGELEGEIVEVDTAGGGGGDGGAGAKGEPGGVSIQGGVISVNLSGMLGGGGGAGRGRDVRRLPVREARPFLEESEAERLLPHEVLVQEAVTRAQEDGIVFIDEIDKIVHPTGTYRHGSDPSSEGVQRDLLPVIEGSVVTTKHGPVSTDHVLFICSGAFTACKPSDMLAELQGRLPIRVELQALTAAEFHRILTEPEFNMIQQHQALLAAEGVALHFTDAAIREVAALAEQINKEVDNIGARRLHTVLERLVADISFNAPEMVEAARAEGLDACTAVIDKEQVTEKVGSLLTQQDMSKYIL